jgi:TolB-like protein/DNA-binding winged helix-turn-helix (wHTH) protein
VQSSAESGSLIRFGVFELDLRSRELRKRGVKVKLQQQPLDLLHILLERRPDAVTREEIRERLWPVGVHVDFDRSLNKAVVKLREALGDDAESPRFVETLPRYGYRFIAPVERGQGPPELGEGPAPATQTLSALPVDPRKPETGANEEPSTIGRGLAITNSPPDAARHEAASNDAATGARSGTTRRMWMAGSAWTAFLILTATGTWWLWREKAGSVKPLQALAVLPLDNLSGDPEQQYFADGMTESLITELGQISPLRIISHTSVKGYQGSKKSIAEIARDLQVDAVIEGTVARSGDHLRVTANLIQVNPERHLWAGSYDRNVRDMLELENELASAIVTEVQGRLTPLQQARLR